MQRLLDNLRTIPGVIGACVHHGSDGVRFNNLPTQFKPERLDEIGGQLIRICSAGRLSFPDLSEFIIAYEESLLLCHPLSAHECLLVVCEPTINQSFLTLSLNLALVDLAPAARADDAPAAGKRAAAENPRETGPLAKPLQGMANQLAKIIGPMAFFVFDETVAAWQAGQAPTPAGLNKLLDHLCQEIGDPEKARQYRELVRKQLQFGRRLTGGLPMSASQRFAQQMARINGVGSFLLARNDGQVIVHNLPDADDLAATVTLAGSNALALHKTFGCGPLKYLLFNHPLGEHLLVFALGKYFLGVRQRDDCDSAALIAEIAAYLQTLLHQKRPG